VTIWDKIINNPDEAQLQLYSASQKYKFNDIAGDFKNFNATYALRWNIVPWVGLMRWGKGSEGYLALPTPPIEKEPEHIKG
jgi:signal peptidase complex subunit 3